MGRKRINDEDRKKRNLEIQRLYLEENLSCRTLALRHDLWPSAVSDLLRKMGTPMRPAGRGISPNNTLREK